MCLSWLDITMGRFWWRRMIGCHGWRKSSKNLTEYSKFKFSSKKPGKVDCYKTLKSTPIEKTLLKDKEKDMLPYLTTTSPQILPPNGLDEDRQMYLFNHIREFCKHGTEDYVAPNPAKKKRK